ncbi:hypothetical protein [Gloeocapsopsis sp. IPPAS B-1203]|uniref:hypothetical protein n=1 Tax=Gloeocapsopsis sp. IPPAS B-1203 TaxID=2049454 RepID=UPI000C18BB06|nr:hypothetical protein [Gloeocapsopsis sp. IPPAS B-1203]PIG93604.1 hypothetical protein CSQ79_08175 [Gloeocapsopsis sp. IPPAS B-1203]
MFLHAAEQIDSLALAIFNHEFKNKATLIGHDTGIGKTRIVCGLARYAQQPGLTPVIVTADPVLYTDILTGDGVDTGNNFNSLIANNGMRVKLTSPDGTLTGSKKMSLSKLVQTLLYLEKLHNQTIRRWETPTQLVQFLRAFCTTLPPLLLWV